MRKTMMTLYFFSICITLRTKSMPEYSRLLVETRDRTGGMCDEVFCIRMMTRFIFAQREKQFLTAGSRVDPDRDGS